MNHLIARNRSLQKSGFSPANDAGRDYQGGSIAQFPKHFGVK
jgi:hypothetical protein